MKKYVSLLLVLCMLFGLCTVAAGAESEQTMITIGLAGEPDTLVPYIYTSDKDSLVEQQMFPYMLETDMTGNVVNGLVEVVSFDSETLTYVWKLNDGLTWSDGEKLDIDDVIFTLNALAKPEYVGGSSTLVADIVGYADVNSGAAATMSGVQKLDEYTISIQLVEWDPTFLGGFCDPGAILPEHVLGGIPSTEWTKTEFAEHPISYGPYKLIEWEHGEYIRLEKNEYYTIGEANIDVVIMRFAESATALVNAYTNQEIDMFKAPFEDVETLAMMPFSTMYVCSASNFPLYPNLIKGPLSDTQVRKAVLLSYNPDLIAATVFGDYGAGAKSVYSNNAWCRNPEIDGYAKEDHDAAKALLEGAGYTMGSDGYYQKDGETLQFSALTTGGEQQDCLTMFQAMLKKSGIKVDIKLVDWSVMVETISDQENADYGTYCFGGGETTEPSGLMILYATVFDASLGGFNFNKCYDETLDGMWFAGRAEMDTAKRKEIYQAIDAYMYENALLFPLFEKSSVWMVNSRVSNVTINSLSNLQYLDEFTVN